MLLEEYKEVSLSIRDYGSKRFSQLTFMSAITGATVVGISSLSNKYITHLVLPFLALAFSISLLVMEKSSTRFWMLFYSRAIEIEEKMGFNHYRLRPSKRFLSATNAVLLMYYLVIFCWGIIFINNLIKFIEGKI